MIPTIDIAGGNDLKRRWGRCVLVGALLVALGAAAITTAVTTTQLAMLVIGALLAAAGVFTLVHGFAQRGWGGLFLDLLTGTLYIVVGFLMLANPAASAATLTLAIAMFLLFAGLLRSILAISLRFPHWGWLLFSGSINLLLGMMIWRQWPLAGLWLIGFVIGLELMLYGWSLILLGLTVKRLP